MALCIFLCRSLSERVCSTCRLLLLAAGVMKTNSSQGPNMTFLCNQRCCLHHLFNPKPRPHPVATRTPPGSLLELHANVSSHVKVGLMLLLVVWVGSISGNDRLASADGAVCVTWLWLERHKPTGSGPAEGRRDHYASWLVVNETFCWSLNFKWNIFSAYEINKEMM